MPIVQIEMLEGRTLEQKRAMVKEVTEAICRTLNATPDAVRIIIREMPFEHFAVGGVLRSDQKK
ncbi:MAG TPA: 4-oxalocrotonate tautomerase [Firmicutes bacterium]|nr:4-oxalocrotonate tautomerase [Candidatus Fermentithermobacillaceae bacterium]